MDIGSAVERIKIRKKKNFLFLILCISIVLLAYFYYPIYKKVKAVGYHIAALHTQDPLDAAQLETRSQAYTNIDYVSHELNLTIAFDLLDPHTYQKNWCQKFLKKSYDIDPKSTFRDQIRIDVMACQYVIGNKREAIDEARIYALEERNSLLPKIRYDSPEKGRGYSYLSLINWASGVGRYDLADELVKESTGYKASNGREIQEIFTPGKLNEKRAQYRKKIMCNSQNFHDGFLAYICYKTGFIKYSQIPTHEAIRAYNLGLNNAPKSLTKIQKSLFHKENTAYR